MAYNGLANALVFTHKLFGDLFESQEASNLECHSHINLLHCSYGSGKENEVLYSS